MALLFADSFEHYGTGTGARVILAAGEYADAGVSSVVTSFARTGSRCIRDTWNGSLRKLMDTTHNEVGVALGFYVEALPSTVIQSPGFRVTDVDNTTIVSLTVDPSGAINVFRGNYTSNVLLGATDSGLITAQAWNHIEMRVLQDNVVGEVEVRVNGNPELVLNNLDLGTVLPRFWVGGPGGSTSSMDRYFDDLILWDTTGDVNNTFFGPARVTTGWLAADESGNQWSVVGADSGAEAMTELVPDGDTSYVSAAVVGMVSEFSIQELPPEAEAIAGIYIPTMAKLSVAGIGNMQVSVVSGSDVAHGKDNPLTAAYTYRGDVFEKDPATGQLWTKGGLEAALIRIEKTA